MASHVSTDALLGGALSRRSENQLQLKRSACCQGKAVLVQVAAPPTERSNAPHARDIALGLCKGLLFGLGLALLMDSRDKTTKSAVEMLEISELPTSAHRES